MALLSLLIALAVQAAPPPAQAAWRPLGRASDGRPVSYDPASVARTPTVVRARLRFESTEVTSFGTAEVRCSAFEARITGLVSYAADGREVGRNDMMMPFRAIAAGGFLDALAREVCGAAAVPARPD